MTNKGATTEEALFYMVDYTLATVSSMAMKKTRPKGEYSRQIRIAQQGIDWLQRFNVMILVDSRPYKVIALHNGKVEEWAKVYEF